jgi:hypothetical protein
MPEVLHKKLEKQGRNKGLKGKRLDAYIYGTLSRIEKRIHDKGKRAKRR